MAASGFVPLLAGSVAEGRSPAALASRFSVPIEEGLGALDVERMLLCWVRDFKTNEHTSCATSKPRSVSQRCAIFL